MSGGVDTTVVAAFAVGFVSFISPCVLPLVPGYLSAVSGVTLAELQRGERANVLLPALDVLPLASRSSSSRSGMTATGLGSTLQDPRDTLDVVAGSIIVALGVLFVITPFVPRLNREWRPDALIGRAGSGGPLVAGAAFAFAWTPCVGPTLGAILTAACVKGSVGEGALLLAFYSAGLAVPFMLTAVAFNRATTAFRWLRDRWTIVTALSGLVLIAMGVLLLTGELTRLNGEAQQALDSIGLNVFKRPVIVVLDVGSSSLRASLWERDGSSLGEKARIEQAGTGELDADALLGRVARVLDRAAADGREVTAVATSTLWHCLLGLDDRRPAGHARLLVGRRALGALRGGAARAPRRARRSTPAPAAACTRATGRPSSPGCATPSPDTFERVRRLGLARRVRPAPPARRRRRQRLDGLRHRPARPARVRVGPGAGRRAGGRGQAAARSTTRRARA